jgi:hypothetical protein
MGILEKGLFILGIGAFVASAVTAGTLLGDIFWRAGIATLLTDLVLIQLWPAGNGTEVEL